MHVSGASAAALLLAMQGKLSVASERGGVAVASLRSGPTMKHKEKACKSCRDYRRSQDRISALSSKLPACEHRISRLRAAAAAQAGGGPCDTALLLIGSFTRFNESSKQV